MDVKIIFQTGEKVKDWRKLENGTVIRNGEGLVALVCGGMKPEHEGAFLLLLSTVCCFEEAYGFEKEFAGINTVLGWVTGVIVNRVEQ